LRHDNGSCIDGCRGAVWNDSSRFAAGNDDSALNSDSSDRSRWVGGSSRHLRGATEDGWVRADLVHTEAHEVVLGRSDVTVRSTVSIKTLVDGADQALRGAVAISIGVRVTVALQGDPGVQALGKNAWVWKRGGAR
jgi:hypothetical protein